jgi:uncharacterized protein DUF3349
MALPGVLQRIVGWLRAGYPDNVPEHDYMPIFALLATQLSDEEVRETVHAVPTLARGGGQDETVSELIYRVRSTPPSEEDIARVLAHLKSVGWDFDVAAAGSAPVHDNGSQSA